MKKRAQLTLKGLIELVAVAIVIFILIYIAVSRSSGEAFFKERSAKELALLLNTLCSLPGNAEIIFPTDLSKFNVQVENNVVYVYDTRFAKNTDDPVAGKYQISKPNCNLEASVKEPKTLIVRKRGNKINFIEGNVKIT